MGIGKANSRTTRQSLEEQSAAASVVVAARDRRLSVHASKEFSYLTSVPSFSAPKPLLLPSSSLSGQDQTAPRLQRIEESLNTTARVLAQKEDKVCPSVVLSARARAFPEEFIAWLLACVRDVHACMRVGSSALSRPDRVASVRVCCVVARCGAARRCCGAVAALCRRRWCSACRACTKSCCSDPK